MDNSENEVLKLQKEKKNEFGIVLDYLEGVLEGLVIIEVARMGHFFFMRQGNPFPCQYK